MLAIKTLTSRTGKGATLIFDEVDAGIGGHTADVVGRRLQSLAADAQVLCITHLPQIAAVRRPPLPHRQVRAWHRARSPTSSGSMPRGAARSSRG